MYEQPNKAETGLPCSSGWPQTHCGTQAGLEFVTLLIWMPECWDCGPVPLHLIEMTENTNTRLSETGLFARYDHLHIS